MNVFYEMFTKPELNSMASFCEKYISLADQIITLKSDELDRIERAFEKVKDEFMLGRVPAIFKGMKKREITIYFLKQKIEVLEEVMRRYPATEIVVRDIIKLVRKHNYEVEKLELLFRNFDITEIYCNYLSVVKKLDIIKFDLEVHEHHKKGGRE